MNALSMWDQVWAGHGMMGAGGIPVDHCTLVQVCNQLTRYYVLEHPLLLTMLDIHDVPPHPSHTHLITLVERNLFQQQVAIYSLQMPTKDDKVCPKVHPSLCCDVCLYVHR